MSLGIGLYLIPLGMIANPALIELGTAVVPSLLAVAKMAISLGMISFVNIAPKAFFNRTFLVLGGVIILYSLTDLRLTCDDKFNS
jgi:hypothetical protein